MPHKKKILTKPEIKILLVSTVLVLILYTTASIHFQFYENVAIHVSSIILYALFYFVYIEVNKRTAYIDWRARAVLFILIFSSLATSLTYTLGYGQDPSTFFGAVFASWTSSIIFFTLVGAIVTIISLTNAAKEPFHARARILFRGQSGSHIDYIVDRIKCTLEHYSVASDRTIVVMDHDLKMGMVRLAKVSSTTIKSYIDDTQTTYRERVSIKAMSQASSLAANKVAYIRWDNSTILGPTKITGAEFNYDIEYAINQDESPTLEYRIENWIKLGAEKHNYTPSRYTKALNLKAENSLSQSIIVTVSTDGDTKEQKYTIPPGHIISIGELRDLKPNEKAYSLNIELS